MAANAITRPTLLDLEKVIHNGKIMNVILPFAQTNQVIQDFPVYEANDIHTHLTSVNTSEPSGSFRGRNQGVAATKSVEKDVRFDIANYVSRSEIDEDIVKDSPNPMGFRQIKDDTHISAQGKKLANTIFHGDRADMTNYGPAAFDGFEKILGGRYADLSVSDYSGDYDTVIDGGGTGSDLMSVWLVQWGPDTAYMVHPRGHMSAGVETEDKDIEKVLDADSLPYYAYVSQFKWQLGLVVEDDRAVRRIANLESAGTSNNFLGDDVEKLIDALATMKDMGEGASIYMNRTAWTQFRKAAKDKTNVSYPPKNPWGQALYDFDGHPIRIVDVLGITEDAIT